MEQNKQNFIPPSSRMTNYVVLRFGDLKPDPNVSSRLLIEIEFYLHKCLSEVRG